MITLLLGTDLLSKKEYLVDLTKKLGAELQEFTDATLPTDWPSLLAPQLFGAPKILVLNGCWKAFNPEQVLEAGNNQSAQIVLLEESLDKRKKVNTEFLKDKRVNVVVMDAPVGTAASTDWIMKLAKNNQVDIQANAAQALAKSLLIDEDSSLDVLRISNELQKLQSYAAGKTITAEMVNELTENVAGVNVFDLLNAIGAKNKSAALKILEQYFSTESGDEKSNAIKVVALLADQFRSLLVAADSAARKLPDQKILKTTGWKSGRLFIMKKLSRNFSPAKLAQALQKLENLDQELKTGTMPPHVVLDLIIADM